MLDFSVEVWQKCEKIRKMYSDPLCTVCPISSDPFYIVTHCINWDTTSWILLYEYKMGQDCLDIYKTFKKGVFTLIIFQW